MALSGMRTLTSVREDDGKEGRRLSTLPMSFRRVRPTFWERKGQGAYNLLLLKKAMFPLRRALMGLYLPSEVTWGQIPLDHRALMGVFLGKTPLGRPGSSTPLTLPSRTGKSSLQLPLLAAAPAAHLHHHHIGLGRQLTELILEVQHGPYQLHDIEVHQVVGPIQVGCGLDGLGAGISSQGDVTIFSWACATSVNPSTSPI